MTPKLNIFGNPVRMFWSGHGFIFRRQIWSFESCQSKALYTAPKNAETSEPQYCPQWSDRAHNFLHVVVP